MAITEVKVPDIGDFKDIPVIEIMVKPGDTVKPEDPLMSLESDKATMDVPSPAAGVVKELKVKVGDKVSEGSVILTLDAAGAGAAAAPCWRCRCRPGESRGPASGCRTAGPHSQPSPAGKGRRQPRLGTDPRRGEIFGQSRRRMRNGRHRRRARRLLRCIPLGRPRDEDGAGRALSDLGGVCLNVGCIPSKALLHTAAVVDEVKSLPDHGITFGKPEIDLNKLRGFKDGVVKKLTGGLAGMAKMRKVEVITGVGTFLDPNHLEVALRDASGKDTGKKVVKFAKCIIAAGSQAVKLPFMPEDPRIFDSTGALLLTGIPKRMLVVGAGIIGLEMATVYSTLGTRLEVVEMLDIMMAGADRDLVKVWEKVNAPRFDKIMLKTKTVGAEATKDGIKVKFEGENAPKEAQLYDAVLVAVGRSPNGKKLNARRPASPSPIAASSTSTSRCAPTSRIFSRSATSSASRCLRTRPSTKRTSRPKSRTGRRSLRRAADPVGRLHRSGSRVGRQDRGPVQGRRDQVRQVGVPLGRVRTRDRQRPRRGLHQAAVRREDAPLHRRRHRRHARGDLIGEVCLAVEMGCDPVDIGKTIHPHPTLSESIGMAAEVFEGVCTDLPPVKKK
jgi:dihydrolipoamide dehydrogenase